MSKKILALLLTTICCLSCTMFGCAGEQGPTGPQGPQGEQGAAGPQGEQGPAGKGISSIEINEEGHLIITYTDSNVPVDLGLVVGKDGENGVDAVASDLYNGTDNPANALGKNGDYYMDTNDFLLYVKKDGVWEVLLEKFGGIDSTQYYTNLFNVDDADTKSKVVLQDDGSEKVVAYSTTASCFIPVELDTQYVFKDRRRAYQYGGGWSKILLYDENKNFVAKSSMTSFDDGGTPYDTNASSSLDDDTFGIKVSSKNYPTVKYVRFNIQCPQELMFLKGDTYYNIYVAYGEKKVVPGTDSTGGGLTDADREMLEKANPLYGKKVGWQGSSSMEGAGYAGGFAKIIAEENNMTSVNLAKSGGLLISGTDKHAICQGVINLCENSTYDYIIFNGGLNDASSDRSSPLGEISQGYTAELDMTTVAGAFEAACRALSRSGKKVGYIFTHKVYKDDHAWATQYKPLMEKILKKWGIPYIDLEVLVPAFNLDPVMKELYTSNADGWHANELGYRTFYVDKITAWMKTL